MLAAMTEVSTDQLKQAVESQHGGKATLAQSVPVKETQGSVTVWEGVVHVFDLRDSPSGATRAYAWSYERDDGKRRFFAVLHTGPILSPRDAVRAAIVAEARAAQDVSADARPTCVHCGQKFEWNAGSVTDEVAVCDVCLGD